MSRFIICCGGTGGHLAPGIAVAEALLQQGHACWLIISRKEVDARLISHYPHLNFLRAPGCSITPGWKGMVRFLSGQWQNFFFSLRIFYNLKPNLILAFGGFMSVAPVLAGLLKRIPVALHEANQRMGKAIRWLRPWVDRVYIPEGICLPMPLPQNIRYCGYPVRTGVQRLEKQTARRRLGIETEGKLLVVLGGSQGARPLNEWARDHFQALAHEKINVYCLTGLGNDAPALEGVAPNGQVIKAYFKEFSDQMAEVLSSADLVVARAGAGTLAEIVRCAIPSIFIPYPYCSDNHQWENAHFLERQGAGLVVPQTQLGSLLNEVKELLNNPFLLENFRKNLQRLNQKNHLEVLVADLLSLLPGKGSGASSENQKNRS